MTRYVTRNYVAVSEAEARRLAAIDSTSWEKVKITKNVEPLHRTGSWVLWSDGKFTTSIGLSKDVQVRTLSKDAEDLISVIEAADGGEAKIEGGLLTVARVEKIVQVRTVDEGPSRGVYAKPKIEAYWVKLNDGSEHTWYAYSEGYPEGYVFALYGDFDDLQEDLRKYAEE